MQGSERRNLNIEAGETLLHYRLIEKIGEGGMGVVWKAVDTTLDRTVAIKLLPETFTADPERLGRFEREAKSLAALNDPRIAGIYGLHQDEANRFIAMELVEGEDLAARLARGPLPVEDAVAIAGAIAGALSTAHGNGVVHRDLKPGNVMLTPDDEPKVLDFGLAKAVAPDGTLSGSQPAGPAHSPTVTSFGTVAGVIIGTAAYMSPEQARGRPVDRRADIWALGVILYEMLVGKAPFHGETISDTLADVLRADPDWDALPETTPAAVRRLLRRCLEKDPRNRLHDAADARIELAEAFDETEPGPAPTAAGRSAPGSRGLWVAITAVALIGGLALGFLLRGGDGPDPAPGRRVVSSIPAPDGVTLNVRQLSLALSPDGEQLAFVGVDGEGRSHLYVRRLDATEARRLDGTEGARTPFWSPEGLEIGYHAATRLMRVPAEGGTPQVIAETDGSDGTWNRDGTILFTAVGSGPLARVDAGGGEPRIVEGTLGGPGQQSMTPQFLPDGRHFIFQREALGGGDSGVYLGDLESGEVTRLAGTLWNATYADGHLVFVRDDIVMAQPLDIEGRRLTGEPRRIAGPVVRLNYPFIGFFSASQGGNRLAYLHGSQAAGLAELVWVDRSGAEIERPGIRGDLYNARLSHDDRRIAIDVSTTETHGDIWIYDLARGSSRRLTRDPVDESRPVWTPDDSQIVFFRVPDLYLMDAGGESEPREIFEDPNEKFTTDLSSDGRWVMFIEVVDGNSSLRVLDLESGEARDWLRTEFDESQGRFSPDGRWVAYDSTETGSREVYVDRFPDRGERFRISTDGGSWPVWRRDGGELFYYSATNDLMAVPVTMDSDRDPVGKPVKLFSPRLRRAYFDVSADGERFLLTRRVDPEVSSITLIQNWTETASE
jgi:Tol biopolymer transport system component